jgi:hypothetical protein
VIDEESKNRTAVAWRRIKPKRSRPGRGREGAEKEKKMERSFEDGDLFLPSLADTTTGTTTGLRRRRLV